MTTQVANPPVQSIRLLFGALLLVMLLSALDQTIVSTALPTIVGELGAGQAFLGGHRLYPQLHHRGAAVR